MYTRQSKQWVVLICFPIKMLASNTTLQAHRNKQNARRNDPAGVVLNSGRWAPAVLSDQNL